MRQLNRAAVGVVASAVALGACAPNGAEPLQTEARAVISNGNLDLLFMIDNSSSMLLSQTNLLRNIPTFMNVLENLPGGLPNIHVAVVSSDMGAGSGLTPSCTATGDDGVFRSAPRGTCTSTTLPPGATFISNVGGTTNYTAPDITTVFSCIAALGQDGCGFERPFASVLRALGADGRPAPPENQGFLRSDALLAIVMVTNEDDCSARDGSGAALYAVDSGAQLTSDYGAPNRYRCNEFGHLCDGIRPPRMAPNGQAGDTVTLQSCTSSECDGALTPVAEVAARIKALKTAPASEVLIAAITGPVTPYEVRWDAPSVADTSCGSGSCPWPQVAHSCAATDDSYADPAVRVTQLTSLFGANGFVSSICDADFGPALQQIANRIGTLLLAGGDTGGPAGRIPTCAVTGIGGEGGATGTGGVGGSNSSGGGGPGSDAAADTGVSTYAGSGCSCQTGGGLIGVWGFGVAGVIIAVLARRRRAVRDRTRPWRRPSWRDPARCRRPRW
jgi:hypothetical protein